MQLANSFNFSGQGKPFDKYIIDTRKLYFEILDGYTKLFRVAMLPIATFFQTHMGYMEGMKIENLDLRNIMWKTLNVVVFPYLRELQSLDLSNGILQHMNPGNNGFLMINKCTNTNLYQYNL